MKRKKLLYFTIPSLIEAYQNEYPEIVRMAVVSDTLEQFKHLLSIYIHQLVRSRRAGLPKNRAIKQFPWHAAAKRIHQMLALENQRIGDFAGEKEIRCESVVLLWKTLQGEDTGILSDFLLDWYYLFRQLHAKEYLLPSVLQQENNLKRWKTGVDEDIFYKRCGNRTFIQQLLIRKIDARQNLNSRYRFKEGLSLREKLQQVRSWWFDYRFQLTMAIRHADELNYFMGMTLPRKVLDILHAAERKNIPIFITPYYLSLLSMKAFGYDDSAIRSYVLYSAELVEEFGKIKAWEKEDRVRAGEPNAAGWLLPNTHNIHRRYPDVAIFIPDSRGRACGGLCAVCQRMYGFQQGEFNFDLEKLAPREDWDKRLQQLMEYFEHDSRLRDILITGGDALMSSNCTLKKILEAILQMARRKREANKHRKDGEKYALIQRVRLGSRMLAYLPYRIDNELVGILEEFQQQASQIGISQLFLQTHFESPLEISVEVMEAVKKIQKAGWMITNQHVLTVASSRRGHNAALRQTLNRIGILPYYTFSVKGFRENRALAVPNCRQLQEIKEEKISGELNPEINKTLQGIVASPQDMQHELSRLLNTQKRPFIATDRNVMNLPGIGKSMTFSTVGISADGRRILCFTPDNDRPHSPRVKDMGKIYIVESKSVASYLRQLEDMGEQAEDYDSVWYYQEGKTETVNEIFNYPPQEYLVTQEFTHFKQQDS